MSWASASHDWTPAGFRSWAEYEDKATRLYVWEPAASAPTAAVAKMRGWGMPRRQEAGMPLFKVRKAAQILQLAQQTADQAIADAQREAEAILARARQEAERTIADAKTRAEGL
jgi:cell division septum initiation protein DivIVA